MLTTFATRLVGARHATPTVAAATATLLVAGLLAAVLHDKDNTRLSTDSTTTTTAADLTHDTTEPTTDSTVGPLVGQTPTAPLTTATTAAPTSTTTTAFAQPTCLGSASTIDSSGLWVVDVADGRLRRVVAEGIERFAWSPDGKRLAYLAGPQDDRRLVVLDIGGASRTVYEALPAGHFDWTADSSTLMVAVRAETTHDRIVAVPAAGGGATDVVDTTAIVGDLEVRPDGTIVFTDGGTLAMVDADGSDRRNLIDASAGRAVHNISVSGDGKHVAYTDSKKFGVLTVESAAVKELGDSESPGFPLAWSTDGTRVAFVPVQGGRFLGAAARPDGAELRTVGTGGSSFGMSPNGREIGWVSASGLTATDLSTGKERLVGKDLQQPTWAPDSGSLAVYAKVANEARPALCLVGVGSRRVAQFKGNASPFSALAWSPSGATIAFASLA
ncbi:MAG TPA: hypothetical protein VM938_04295 [Acidimicrobiales bacterium]|nr:hypothetical protein [Acidimicrobiales bacterium]